MSEIIRNFAIKVEQKLIYIEQTDSTNRWLKEHQPPFGATEEIVVWTDFQTAGRGCGTNTWESQQAKNLLFSLLCHPTHVKADRQFVVSEAIALALWKVAGRYVAPERVSIKWPNDLYVDDRKLAGILIENKLRGAMIADCIIGVGLNVNQQTFVSDAPNPVSLAQLTGKEHDREELLRQIVEAFGKEMARTETEPQAVHADYLNHLYRRNGFHRYEDAEGLFEARLETIEADGHLILSDRTGRQRRYAFKEVKIK